MSKLFVFRPKRVVAYIAASILVATALAAIAIHLQQRAIAKQASTLFEGLRELELRKGTRAQAMSLMSQSELTSTEQGDCPNVNCVIDVELRDFAWKHISLFGDHPWLFRAYGFLGGKGIRINSSIAIIDGVVWGKDFVVTLEVTPRWSDEARYPYTLLAVFETKSNFWARVSAQLILHPYYEIGRPGGCEGCVEGWVYFTPYANPTDVRRIMQLNFSCLTSWNPCRDESDIIPVPWAEHIAEDAQIERLWPTLQKCGAEVVALVARDSQNIAVVTDVSNRIQQENGDSFQVSSFRLVRPIKRAAFWNVGQIKDVRVFDGSLAPSRGRSAVVAPGKQFILLFDHGKRDGDRAPDIWLDNCGIVPATDHNIALIEEHAREDFRATHPNPVHPQE